MAMTRRSVPEHLGRRRRLGGGGEPDPAGHEGRGGEDHAQHRTRRRRQAPDAAALHRHPRATGDPPRVPARGDPRRADAGGYARLKTAIDRERAAATGPAFLVDSGDEFQGSGPATWSEGQVILDPLNALGTDIFLPGNWEAAYGPRRFKQTMAALKTTVVCYNLHDEASGQRLFEPAHVIERDGVRVAFVGITDILASKRQRPVEWAGMDTTRIEGLRQFVQDLKAKEKPDLVVAVMHTGLTISRQVARDIPEFDVALSGHTHERTQEPILEGKVNRGGARLDEFVPRPAGSGAQA